MTLTGISFEQYQANLLDLYEAGECTRAEYLASNTHDEYVSVLARRGEVEPGTAVVEPAPKVGFWRTIAYEFLTGMFGSAGGVDYEGQARMEATRNAWIAGVGFDPGLNGNPRADQRYPYQNDRLAPKPLGLDAGATTQGLYQGPR